MLSRTTLIVVFSIAVIAIVVRLKVDLYGNHVDLYGLAASFSELFSSQFRNQTIAGSFALGGAALLTKSSLNVVKYLKELVTKSIFTVYIIPKRTPQYTYFVAWLKAQPVPSSNILEVNMGVKSSVRRNAMHSYKTMKRAEVVEESPDEKGSDIALIPSLGTTTFLRYHDCFLWITTGKGSVGSSSRLISPREKDSDGDGFGSNDASSYPSITLIGSRPDIITSIIREGRELASRKSNRHTTVFTASNEGGDFGGRSSDLFWREAAVRPVRRLTSIILPGKAAEHIAQDCKDFLESEEWYCDRGIPYRRGYLLHGKPGCGKTSLVTAIAGHLNLNVYIISLTAPGIHDDSLLMLLNNTPPHTILLMEDIDAIFDVSAVERRQQEATSSSTKALADTQTPSSTHQQETTQEENSDTELLSSNPIPKPRRGERTSGISSSGTSRTLRDSGSRYGAAQSPPTPRLTFAGILNAIDGVAAQTGRLLFMTTNHKERLDPALIRPGRIDYQMYFQEASREQVNKLFLNFYGILAAPMTDDLGVISESGEQQKQHQKETKINALAQQFADVVPEGQYTMSQIQGIFMRYRLSPEDVCANAVSELERLDQEMGRGCEETALPSMSLQLSRESSGGSHHWK
jgi:hypothetical protein